MGGLVRALIAVVLIVAGADASPETRACVAESCRPAGRDCAGAFRATKRPALAECVQTSTGAARRKCRREVQGTVRKGVQSCRSSLHDCITCCRKSGEACQVRVCGNALLEVGEACDGEARGSCGGSCRSDCTCASVPRCGNAHVEGREQCDGAEDGACPGRCRGNCTCGPASSSCGNDVVDNESEDCDGVADAACPGACHADCTCTPPPQPACGNGVLEQGEACEPEVSELTCGTLCQPDCTCAVCGNHVVEPPGEVCEDGDDAACPGLCSSSSCRCLLPTTDSCEAPREIDALPFLDRQSTETATVVIGDPVFACVPGNRKDTRTVWYALTATASGRVRADTVGSTFDTLLAAHSGSCDATTSIACNDDAGFGGTSRIEFPVSSGVRYLLEAAAYDGAGAGDLVLAAEFVPCGNGMLDQGEACEPTLPDTCSDGSCSPQCECLAIPADECASATLATVLPIDGLLAAYGSTGNADDPKPSCASSSISPPPSSWFRFQAPRDGTVAIDTSGSDYDTVLGVFTGGCDALTPSACNDDGGAGKASLVSLTVSTGVDYTVLVLPYANDPAGRLELSIAYQEP